MAHLKESAVTVPLAWYNREPVCLHEDPAHPLGLHPQTPLRNTQLTIQMVSYNKAPFVFKMHIPGSIVSDKFGVPPPSLQEYLYAIVCPRNDNSSVSLYFCSALCCNL